MADLDVQANNLGRTSVPTHTAGQTVTPLQFAVFQNIGTMKTYLLAHGYTAAQLLSMTKQDLVYACKTDMGITG